MAHWKAQGRIYKVAGINDLPSSRLQLTRNHVFTVKPQCHPSKKIGPSLSPPVTCWPEPQREAWGQNGVLSSQTMAEKPPVILTIAGFDPSSGAGITADVKTIAAHGCYGVACVTALTVQSTSGVRRFEPVDPDLIRDTLEELEADLDIAAVHIGMLGSAKVVKAVADFLEADKAGNTSSKRRTPRISNIVLDPIVKSSSGADLLDSAGTKLLIERLIPLSDVITPNTDEASALTGLRVNDLATMREAAAKLHHMGASAVVITGGDLEKAIDLLSYPSSKGTQQEVFKAERQRSSSTHGTGCAFATSMACHLALDRGLAEATLLSKTFVSAAIANAQILGKGTGPVHHLYRMTQQRRATSSGGE